MVLPTKHANRGDTDGLDDVGLPGSDELWVADQALAIGGTTRFATVRPGALRRGREEHRDASNQRGQSRYWKNRRFRAPPDKFLKAQLLTPLCAGCTRFVSNECDLCEQSVKLLRIVCTLAPKGPLALQILPAGPAVAAVGRRDRDPAIGRVDIPLEQEDAVDVTDEYRRVRGRFCADIQARARV